MSMNALGANAWPCLRRLDDSPRAAAVLVCFPPAAGTVATFANWRPLMSDRLALLSVCLPGRDHRRTEPPAVELPALATEISSALSQSVDLPLVFFGHSLGALVACEVARQLGSDSVRHLFVAACPAPQLRRQPSLGDLPDELLLTRVQERYGGFDQRLLADEQWSEHATLRLRADLKLAETYRAPEEASLACPITAMGGAQDQAVPPATLAAWRVWTQGPFKHRVFGGGHFFPQTHRAAVVRTIEQDYRP